MKNHEKPWNLRAPRKIMKTNSKIRKNNFKSWKTMKNYKKLLKYQFNSQILKIFAGGTDIIRYYNTRILTIYTIFSTSFVCLYVCLFVCVRTYAILFGLDGWNLARLYIKTRGRFLSRWDIRWPLIYRL